MTITYQAGRRIQGTSTDFGTAGSGIPAVSGGWKELGRSTGTLPDISSIPDKRYYMLLNNGRSWTSGSNSSFRFNSDTGTNYAFRDSRNGAADYTETSSARTLDYIGTGSENELFGVSYISNLAAKEKLLVSSSVVQKTAGAGTAPSRDEVVSKWSNTSAAINRITATSTAGAASEYVMLGWDPTDTHTSNFWEELASVDLSGGVADTISASIADKKYLWIQAYIEGSATATAAFRVGDTSLDSGSNYSHRYSSNGGTDTATTSTTDMTSSWTVGADLPIFWNIFIVNNASNEKLAIMYGARQNAAGAGTAPSRFEIVGKWAETSNQIGIVGFDNTGTGDFNTNCIMKVWGSD